MPINLRYFTEPEFQREIPIQMLEQRYANENAIWDAVACGNTEAALKSCQQMARFTYGGRFFGSLYQTKIMLTVMNTLLRKAIERSNIHPYYIDEISSRYALMIENMVDEESWPLVQTMVKEYSHMCGGILCSNIHTAGKGHQYDQPELVGSAFASKAWAAA